VIGGECLNSRYGRVDNLFVAQVVAEHVEECRRRIHGLEYATAVIIVESNLAGVAETLYNDLRHTIQLQNHAFMFEERSQSGGDRDRQGSRTTHQNKAEMVRLLNEFYLEPRALRIHAQFVTTQIETCPLEDFRLELVKELRLFKAIKKRGFGPDGSTRCDTYYNGKPPHGPGDDLAMALLLAPYNERIFRQDARYATARRLQARR
jgi:hypothetical protein